MKCYLKKAASCVLAAALVAGAALGFAGCGSEEGAGSDALSPPASGKQTSAAAKKTQAEALKAVNILVGSEYQSDFSEETEDTTIYAQFPNAAVVTDEGYDKLQAALDEVFGENAREAVSVMNENSEEFRASGYKSDVIASVEYSADIKRSDSKLVSIVFNKYIGLGGTHPSIDAQSVNIDAQTGKLLKPSDMISDSEAFYDAALVALKKLAAEKQYPDDSYVDKLLGRFENTFDSLTIYTDAQNLYLYFPAETFAPYAAGPAELAVPLSGCGGFMKEEYIYPSGPVIIKAACDDSEYAGGEREAGGIFTYTDGQFDFSLKAHFDYYSYEGSIEMTCDSQTFSKDVNQNVRGVYIVKTGDSQAYAYIDYAGLDYGGNIEVYKIDGKPELVGSVNASFGDSASTVPDDMTLYTYIYKLGSYCGFKKYRVGVDGVPVTDDKEFTFTNMYIPNMYGYTLTSTAELKLDINGKQESFPAGTDFHASASDDETYVVLELDDGRRGRLSVRQDEYSMLVQDASGAYVPEEQCFESIPYAG